jgi:hypothetical protein
MLLGIAILAVIAAGGFAVTYLIESDEPFMWRVGAGSVIGSVLFGTLAFVLATLFGLNSVTATAALLISLSPVILLVKGDRRKKFDHDLAKAKGKLQGATLKKASRFLYYAAFVVLFVFFFDRAMVETEQGIFTGGSNNLGDLPFHLGVIYSFADGANFPPQNPNYAFAKFSYPFIADLITAAFMKFGVSVRDAMFVQNVTWAFGLLVVLEQFVKRLVGNKTAAKLAPPILFFSGGLGFIWFFSDFFAQSLGFFDFLNNGLSKDYTIGEQFRWGNSMITLFLTQRSLLLGMPVTLIVLGTLWKVFSGNSEERTKAQTVALILSGLLAGTLVLVHLHSLFALFVVSGFIIILRYSKDRLTSMLIFGAATALVAIPELVFSMYGSATSATEFFEFYFGWDSGETNFVWFWLKNTGFLMPLIAGAVYLLWTPRKDVGETPVDRKSLLLFYIPFVVLFILSNVAKLAPWQWDNIKVLVYWFVGSIPLVVILLAWMWKGDRFWKVAASICFAVLVLAGTIDVWRTVSRQISYRVFDPDAIAIANRLKASTAPNALFLNAPSYNTAIILSGRRSLMRYPGHLASHGIEYREREDDVKLMYRGGPGAVSLMEKYGIEYVLISPEEKASMGPNEAFFSRYPVVVESGQYRVYKVSK